MKRKTTRNALALSLVSTFLCVSMFIGSTFAWFTDSVTSGNNRIAAGNLDVELEYLDGTQWKTVEGTTNLFSDVAYWEPGAVSVVYLKLANNGTLALKYNLSISATGGDFINAEGNSVNLKNALKFSQTMGETQTTYSTREDAVSSTASTATGFADYSVSGSLKAEEKRFITLVVTMPDTIGNEFNPKSGEDAFIELGINLVANQLSHESDSYGKTYDFASPWVGGRDNDGLTENTDLDAKTVKIESAEQLASFADSVNGGADYSGYTVTLVSDVDLNNMPWTPIIGGGDYIFNGNGKTIKNLKVEGSHDVGLFAYAVGTTIKNLTIDGATVYGINRIGAVIGNGTCAIINNVTVKNSVVWASVKDNNDGDKVGAITGYLCADNGAATVTNCTVENCTLIAYRDIGSVIGMANKSAYPASVLTVTGNTATNVTIKCDRANNYNGFTQNSQYNAGEIVGRLCSGFEVDASNVSSDVSITFVN